MTWIKVYQSVRDHRKIMALAEALDVEETHAVGLCICLWIWAVDNAPDGTIRGSDRAIAKATGWNGDPHALVSGLLESGLLDQEPSQSGEPGRAVHIHDWDYYTGNLIEHRKANVKRVQEWREKNVTRNEHVTYAQRTRTLQGESRVEKKRVEKNTPSVCIYTAQFDEFWSMWPKKGDAKKPAFERWQRLIAQDRISALSYLPNWLPYYASIENRLIPNCTTWLNQARWENDPPPVESRNGNGRVSMEALARKQEREIIDVEGLMR